MSKKYNGEKFNKEAKNHEFKISTASKIIIEKLKELYPKATFELRTKLWKWEIAEVVNPNKTYTSQSNSFIKPDGGIIYMTINNIEYPILISEAKKQGTNDIRKSEGKCKQAKGNAIERAYKNIAEAKLYCKNLDYFPYIIIASGCDFCKGSSILDRFDPMTNYEPRNVDYSLDIDKKVTVYVQSKYFTLNEICDKMLNMSVRIVNHILEDING